MDGNEEGREGSYMDGWGGVKKDEKYGDERKGDVRTMG